MSLKKKVENTREPQSIDNKNYKSAVSKVEKGGKSHTGAVGKYQFTKGTTDALNSKYGTNYDRSKPEDQEKLMDLLTKENTSILKNMNVPVNDTSLYMAHNVGPSATKSLFKNKEKNSIDVIDKSKVWAANPSFYFKKEGKGDRLSGKEIKQLIDLIGDVQKVNKQKVLEKLKLYGYVPMTTDETINKYKRFMKR